MVTFEYDIKGYKSKKYKSITALRKEFRNSDVAKKYPNSWILVYMKRKNGTDDYVGRIATDRNFKNGLFTDVGMKYIYMIDSDGKLKKIPGARYPSRFDPYM